LNCENQSFPTQFTTKILSNVFCGRSGQKNLGGRPLVFLLPFLLTFQLAISHWRHTDFFVKIIILNNLVLFNFSTAVACIINKTRKMFVHKWRSYVMPTINVNYAFSSLAWWRHSRERVTFDIYGQSNYDHKVHCKLSNCDIIQERDI